MADIVPIGFSVDSAPLAQAGAGIEALDAKEKQLALTTKQLTASQAEFDASTSKMATTAASAGTAHEGLATKIKSSATAMMMSEQQMVSAKTATAALTAEHEALATKTNTLGQSFKNFLTSLTGYGQTTQGATTATAALRGEHAATGAGIGTLSGLFGKLTGDTAHASEELEHHASVTAEVRHGAHALHPILRTAGVEMQGLAGFASAARGGLAALAVAGVGALIVALENANDKAEIFKQRLADFYGGKESGASFFEKLSEDAAKFGTSADTVIPVIDKLYLEMGKVQQKATEAARDQLTGAGFKFAPGAGGQAAFDALTQLNSQRMNPQIKEDMNTLETMLEHIGVSATDAKSQAKEFFDGVNVGALGSKESVATATLTMEKLFQMAGVNGKESAKELTAFFSELEKGGLTSKVFEDIATKSSTAAKTIAEGFGFKGPDAIRNFNAALASLGEKNGPSLTAVVSVLNKVSGEVEQMHVPDTVAKSFEHLTDVVGDLWTKIATGSDFKEVSAALDTLSGKIKKLADDPKPLISAFLTLKGLIGDVVNLLSSTGAGEALNETRASGEAANQALFGGTDPISWFLNKMGAPSTSTTGDQLSMWQRMQAPLQTPGFGALSGLNPSAAISDLWKSISGGSTDPDMERLKQAIQQTGTSSDQATSSVDKLKDATTQQSTAATTAATDADKATGSTDKLSTATQTYATAADQSAATIQSAVSKINSAAASVQTGGGSDMGIQAPVDGANVGDNQTGGLYMIAGGGQPDSIPLTGNVSPGEAVAILPQSAVTQSTLQLLQQVIGSSPIQIGPGGSGGSVSLPTTTVGSPTSYGALESLLGVFNPATSTSQANTNAIDASQYAAALAEAGSIGSFGGQGLGVSQTSLMTALAQAAHTQAVLNAQAAGTSSTAASTSPSISVTIANQGKAIPWTGWTQNNNPNAGPTGTAGGGPNQGYLGGGMPTPLGWKSSSPSASAKTVSSGSPLPSNFRSISSGVGVQNLYFNAMNIGGPDVYNLNPSTPFDNTGTDWSTTPFDPSAWAGYGGDSGSSDYSSGDSSGGDYSAPTDYGGYGGDYGGDYGGNTDFWGGGYATGGNFIVPPLSMGRDSIRTTLDLTAGEKVSVTPTAASAYAGKFASGGELQAFGALAYGGGMGPYGSGPGAATGPSSLGTLTVGPSGTGAGGGGTSMVPFGAIAYGGGMGPYGQAPSAPPPLAPTTPIASSGGAGVSSTPNAGSQVGATPPANSGPAVFNIFGVSDMRSFDRSRMALTRLARNALGTVPRTS